MIGRFCPTSNNTREIIEELLGSPEQLFISPQQLLIPSKEVGKGFLKQTNCKLENYVILYEKITRQYKN